MKFCMIDSDNRSAFDVFLMARYEQEFGNKDSLCLGMFDDRGPLGAVILRMNHAVIEIISLDYVEGLEDGECESAIAEFVKAQDWDVYRIEYIVGGKKSFFDDYDYVMMEVGFMPGRGNVRKYHATLKKIAMAQVDTFKLFGKTKDVSEFKIGKDLTRHDIDSYNRQYPSNRYYRDKDNEELSCFMFKNGKITAGVLARDLGDGSLEFQWMDAKHLAPQEVMKLIVYTTVNALGKYPTTADVIVCPFTREVEGLVSRFGFEEYPGDIETRIYTYYL